MTYINHIKEHVVHYTNTRAWPFVQAMGIMQKINYTLPQKGYVLLETGYGPSGLPHIGTFGEVARTIMVQKAFSIISDGMPTKLICVSDDMDGLRKVPENIPNREQYKQYLDRQLTAIPDPFETHASYGDNMNARLCRFLDNFNFKYEFISSTQCYKDGVFNEMLMKVLLHYEEIMMLMLPTLGDERQKTYSPFLPICKRTGKVLQVQITKYDTTAGTVTYNDPETSEEIITSVRDGNCKLQWKPDFGMRWAAFDVDFEMFGKDVGMNANLYTKICKIIGGKAPHQMIYEMYLDEHGKKISKSKGTGLTIEQWLRYAPAESLVLLMYISPQKAKKLSFDIIPRYVDDYIAYLKQDLNEQSQERQYENPIYHISAVIEAIDKDDVQLIASSNISYSLLLNLVSACNTDSADVIWGYLVNFTSDSTIKNCEFITRIVNGAINYYHDFIKPNKKYRPATDVEKTLLIALSDFLKHCDKISMTQDTIQNELYRIARDHNIEMKEWFKALYQILLGSDSGPRFGTFIMLYGIDETIALIDSMVEI